MGWGEDGQRQVFRLDCEGKTEQIIVKEVREAFGCDDKTVRRCLAGLDIVKLGYVDEVVPTRLWERFKLLDGTEHYLRDLRRSREAFIRSNQVAQAYFDAERRWKDLTPDLLSLLEVDLFPVHDFDLASFHSRIGLPSWPIPRGQVQRELDGTFTIALRGEGSPEWTYLRQHLQDHPVWDAIETAKRLLADDISARIELLRDVMERIQQPVGSGGIGLAVIPDVRKTDMDDAVDLYYAFSIYHQVISRCLGLSQASMEERFFRSDEEGMVELSGRPVAKAADSDRRQQTIDYLVCAQTELAPLPENSRVHDAYARAERAVAELKTQVNTLRLAPGFPPGSACDACRPWVQSMG